MGCFSIRQPWCFEWDDYQDILSCVAVDREHKISNINIQSEDTKFFFCLKVVFLSFSQPALPLLKFVIHTHVSEPLFFRVLMTFMGTLFTFPLYANYRHKTEKEFFKLFSLTQSAIVLFFSFVSQLFFIISILPSPFLCLAFSLLFIYINNPLLNVAYV